MLANHPNVLGGGGVATNIIGGTGLFADGTVAAPSISFLADQDTGLYRIGDNQIGVAADSLTIRTTANDPASLKFFNNAGLTYLTSCGATTFAANDVGFFIAAGTSGTQRVKVHGNTGEVEFTSAVLNANGTAAAPSIAFASTINTGFYKYNSNAIGFSAAGSHSLLFSANGYIYGAYGTDQYIQLNNPGNIVIAAAGNNQSITLTPSGTGGVLFPDGSASSPAIAFVAAGGPLGLYRTGNSINFSSTGTRVFYVSSQGITVNGSDSLGSASNPLIAISAAGTTGFFQTAAGSIGISNVGILTLTLDSSQNATFAGNILRTGAAQQIGLVATPFQRGAFGTINVANLNDATDTVTLFNFSTTLATYLPASGAAAAGGSATQKLVIGQTNQGVELFWGSGAPTVTGRKGSLYMRTDGSGINDRMYVNTNGSTTWTSVVTVA